MILVAKKKKRKVLKVKNIVIFFLILVGIIGLFYYAITMPIHNIYIKDNKILSDDEIIKIAGLDDYPSFLLTKKKDVLNRLKKNSYIENVKIKKQFGNVIVISVLEYQPVALNKDGRLILANGMQLDNSYELSDIPILINEIDDNKIFKNFCKKFGSLDLDILRQISQIEYSPLNVDDERFLLYMNDRNLVYVTLTKISKLNRYNGIKDKLEGKIGIIYLDAGDYVELKKEQTDNVIE